ncbi:MAG: cell division protein ZapE [Xanthomonadales bacterium]|nr:cell division protein ZapE [Xanthomonadales bacterium]
MTSPLARYEALLESGDFKPDAEQRRVITALNQLYGTLTRSRRRSFFRRQPEDIKGLYIWGGVGRGKTWMMDLFHDALPFEDKLRIHFHRFMARVHEALRERADEVDPLPAIARRWSREFRVLCFDEFFVSDIADAMLLAGLLEALFEYGVTLVATSNIPPQRLYEGGLQRRRFLPAIELLEQHTEVLEIGGDRDFRLRLLRRSELYYTPLDQHAETVMHEAFERMSAGCEMPPDITVNQRQLRSRRRGKGIIWFDFDTLCKQPRSTLDYIVLARAFNTVLLSQVPVMTADMPDVARRFINLVDEFYDHNVKLLISAEAPIHELYTGQRLAFEFERTRSRLNDMQSHDYLARPHLP